MRGRSLKTITLTLSACALLGACTPEGDPPVLISTGAAQVDKMDVGDSGAGNYLAGRHAQKKRDFSSASRLLEKALQDSPEDTRLLRRTFLTKLADGDIASSAEMGAKNCCDGEKRADSEARAGRRSDQAGRPDGGRRCFEDLPQSGLQWFHEAASSGLGSGRSGPWR